MVVHENKEGFDKLNKNRLLTSIATSSLLAVTIGTTLKSELER
ncbi:hypothetical protein [Peptoniphilus indolicus]|uniref:Uncharacterized protein n=1 Tax=Peptoniphilus indolicus ATCC 29427 TaxID=997350 RepID=G4D758_9FIRM|nr:hypothetical protein [Peptoniphilus indolicus]EGY76264.1 hypothetical protein HMPREF9129_2238 [Peptoniphilus indolicus ATCC 29427]